MMLRPPLAGASLLLAAVAVMPSVARSETATAMTLLNVQGSPLQSAQFAPGGPPPPPWGAPRPPVDRYYDDDDRRYGWRSRCRHWRHECADRWGWRTRDYWRCLRRHDCD